MMLEAPTKEPDFRIEIDPEVFNDVYVPYLGNMARRQIYFGGSSSGKSVFVIQRAVIDLMAGGRNYLICRDVAQSLRSSVYNEMVKVITDFGVEQLFEIKKSEFTITCINGYQALFFGLDDVQKLKSITPAKGVITDIIVEEATETDRDTIKQLEKRLRGGQEDVPKRLSFMFNPILKSHWIYTEYFQNIAWADTDTQYNSPELSILKTTFRDNKFLTDQDRKELENETDPYYYSVYSLGNWGALGHIIFTKWSVVDLSGEQRNFTNHRNGLDFGYSSDPAALSVAHYNARAKELFIYDELYQTGLTNPELAVEILQRINKQVVTCDSAEPKSIKELKNNGVTAIGAKKGKDSVNFGIQWLQQQTVYIDRKCINHRNEWGAYRWKTDKRGEALPEPVEKDDHTIAARRYGSEQDMIVKGKARSFSG